tara:strand:+ start:806 stop:1639 length:834 start_codon:yes stop_codon:yes gene_type:complete
LPEVASISGAALVDVSSIDEVVKVDIASFSGIDFPSSSIITAGLIQHYDISNSSSYPGTGTALTDLSTQGVDGVLVNGVGYSSSDGGYLTFDGTNDYISVSFAKAAPLRITTAELASDGFTVQMWVKPSLSNNRGIWTSNRGYPDTNYQGIQTQIQSSGAIVSHVFDGSGAGPGDRRTVISSSGQAIANVWQLLTWAMKGADGSSYALYKNGTALTGSSVTGTATTLGYDGSNDGSMGQAGTAYYNGDIGGVMVYDYQLTAAEVTTNFNATKTRYGL